MRHTLMAACLSLWIAAWALPGPAGVHAGAQEPTAGAPAPLTLEAVVEMLRAGMDSRLVLLRVRTEGGLFDLTVDDIVRLRRIGASPELIRTLAAGSPAAAESAPAPGVGPALAGTWTVKEALKALEKGDDPAAVRQRIEAEGLKQPLDVGEMASLIERGVPPEVVRALALGGTGVGQPQDSAAGPEAWEEDSAMVAIPAPRSPHTPTDAEEDRLWVSSVPSGARVYLAPARGRPSEMLEQAHPVGITPLSLSLDPGEHIVVVEKEAGAFEQALIPAWRTTHDPESKRSLLDDADLSFDPAACCLPGSLGGQAVLRPVPRDAKGSLIGDTFDGLAPWLFDGEWLQVLRVRETRITHSLKMYRLRKNAGRSRMLISLFLPAEGDPLDQALEGLPPGTPYDAWVDAPGLEALRDPSQREDLAAALGVEAPHLEDAVAMLRRAGKAILHQQIPGGLRLVTLAIEDRGLLRLGESVLTPADPFAPPPPPPKKKKNPKPPPEPPPLPAASRLAVPGLGAPHVTVRNSSARGLGLLLGDGLFVWLPAGAQREAAVDPGTHEVKVLAAGAAPGAPAPRGRLHFSYDARYTITF